MALVLVTGASAGLGRATAEALIRDGHQVVVHSRRPDRPVDSALREGARATVFADLGDARQVGGLAGDLAAFGRFDAVIHNAGVLEGPDVFAVNLVAPYLLTALMPLPRRLIVLSSSMHLNGSTELNGLDFATAARRSRAYDDSKLYLTALAMALDGRYPDLLAHAVDPGWVPTRMGGPSAPDDLEDGNRTQAWLATAPESEILPRSGGYWHHRTPRRAHPAATDPGFQRALIDLLEAQTGVALPE
ncbi:SDR family NAD(P)-dependent oxidoreductase [Microbacterium hydrocarbonoxydans]|uniref:SDR family NAD(P)-dependent oxidoreductase n=1 Tax=Microbacterium hydrocarbonoxydans TaxID=273678 RepID=UPI0007BB97A0|nr:SDR family NAD(P)-dependent oxidoreductase [Microbacterium hydrocarbonoxydans]GAT71996.1 FabG protein [Microbacterium sp. HM58-2]